MRLLALCWAGFILVFFTFSTTQEYYSMPCYPALALLLGVGDGGRERVAAVWDEGHRGGGDAGGGGDRGDPVDGAGLPAPGDISAALTQNPDVYTLSLGHMTDLTLRSFAYLRLPLAVAGVAFLVGAVGAWRLRGTRGQFRWRRWRR